jgi:hypothetical protein
VSWVRFIKPTKRGTQKPGVDKFAPALKKYNKIVAIYEIKAFDFEL